MSWGQFLFSLNGRITRTDFWLKWTLLSTILYLFVFAGLPAIFPDQQALLLTVMGITFVALLWPSIAIPIKRLHDQDRSGLFLLLAFVPVIGGIALLIMLGFLPGTNGVNQYGNDPRQKEDLSAAPQEA